MSNSKSEPETSSEADNTAMTKSDFAKQTSKILIAIEAVQSVLVFLAAIAGITGVLIWVAEGDKREEERILRRIDTSNLAQSIINEMPQDWASYQAGQGPGPQEQALALKAGLFVRREFSIDAVALEADCAGDDALGGQLAFSGERLSLYDCDLVDLSIQARLAERGGGKPFMAFHNITAHNLRISDVGDLRRVLFNEGDFKGLELDLQGDLTKLEIYGAQFSNARIRSFHVGVTQELVLDDGVYEVVDTLANFRKQYCQKTKETQKLKKWRCANTPLSSSN